MNKNNNKSDLNDLIENSSNSFKNNTIQIAVFTLNNNNTKYGININKVKSFVKKEDCILNFNTLSDNGITMGLIVIRQQTYPLISLEKWIEPNKTTKKEKDNIIILAEFSNVKIAFMIDKILRIYNKSSDELEKINVLNDKVSFVTNVTIEDKEELCLILDVESLLEEISGYSKLKNNIDTLNKNNFKKSILVAEDSNVGIKILNKLFNKINVKNNIFINGSDLINYLKSNENNIKNIGLIITDIEMPEKDGFQVLQYIKNSKWKEVPVIVHSSMSNQGVVDKANSLGAIDFINKSDIISLNNIINKYCN